jgi:hypothetical protein
MNSNRWMNLLAVLALVTAGCAASETKWKSEAASLAVYAQELPLYPGIELDDVMGSDSYGDEPESHTEGLTFWFDFKDPKEKVVAWYDQRLPGANKEINEEGDVIYTLTPPNGEPGEDMGVIIEDKRLRVFEHTRGGKHKDA